MKSRQVIAALGALAQETRLDVFRLLVQAGPQGLAAGAIAEELGVPPASLSFHLQQLAHAGLARQRRESRNIFYSADYDGMNALMGYLTQNCCAGAGKARARSCGPKPSAEASTSPRRMRARAA
ncbi:ArsR/SmtB family transcription factor [Desertibaculum subflavum]|uniref:ArsR/SmtB family transcription factor n=1 Tax=Desertibaculum subflavum TaxID=2268458 RepID=UPI000E66B450